MIDYAELRTERRARFFADGDTIVVQAANSQGENLALDVERLDRGEAARQLVVKCCGSGKPTCPPTL